MISHRGISRPNLLHVITRRRRSHDFERPCQSDGSRDHQPQQAAPAPQADEAQAECLPGGRSWHEPQRRPRSLSNPLSLVVVDHTASSITSRPAPVSCTSSSATTSCVPSASSPASSSSTRYEPWSPFRVALAHSSHTRSSPTLRDIIPFCVAQYIICYSSLTDSVTPRPTSQSPMTVP